MVVDPLSSRGVAITPPSAETLARFKAAGIDVKPARIVDVTLAGTRYDVMKAALDILTTAPEYDLILPVIGSSARFHPELAVKPIVDSAGAAKPIAACLVPDAPDALAMLSEAGVPSFRTPEACADAIAAALRRRAAASRCPNGSRRPAAGNGRMLDEIDAGTLIERFGIPRAPAVVLDAGITRAPSLPFAYPVVVKALSAEIAHKTEAGGVVLGVADGDALLAAIKQIRANVAQRRPDTRILRVLVQPMVVGHRRGADRLSRRSRRRPAGDGRGRRHPHRNLPRPQPAARAGRPRDRPGDDRRGARLPALAGFRGRPKGDLDALADAIVALSQLAEDPSIAEAEINPLIVRTDGVVAVDALVKLA